MEEVPYHMRRVNQVKKVSRIQEKRFQVFQAEGPSLSPWGRRSNLHPVEHSEEPLSLCSPSPDLVGSVETGTVCSFSNTLYHTLIKSQVKWWNQTSPHQPPTKPTPLACEKWLAPLQSQIATGKSQHLSKRAWKGHLQSKPVIHECPDPLETQRRLPLPSCLAVPKGTPSAWVCDRQA